MQFTVSKVMQGQTKHIDMEVSDDTLLRMNVTDARELAQKMLYAVESLLEAAELPEIARTCSDRAYELNEYI